MPFNYDCPLQGPHAVMTQHVLMCHSMTHTRLLTLAVCHAMSYTNTTYITGLLLALRVGFVPASCINYSIIIIIERRYVVTELLGHRLICKLCCCCVIVHARFQFIDIYTWIRANQQIHYLRRLIRYGHTGQLKILFYAW